MNTQHSFFNFRTAFLAVVLSSLGFAIVQGKPASDIPEELSGAQIEFQFRSPLRDVQEEAKAGMFTHMTESIMVPAREIDPALIATVDWEVATRESVQGLGVPATWLGKDGAVKQAQEALAKQKEMAAGIEALQAGGDAAQSVSAGAQGIGEVIDAAEAA